MSLNNTSYIKKIIKTNETFTSVCMLSKKLKKNDIKKIIGYCLNNKYDQNKKDIILNIISNILNKEKISKNEKEILLYIINKINKNKKKISGDSIILLSTQIFIIDKLNLFEIKGNRKEIYDLLVNDKSKYLKIYLGIDSLKKGKLQLIDLWKK
jgi:hypothetical protein